MASGRPETCAYCGADNWCEIRANGKPQCLACKIERFFSQVLYPPLGYQLLEWQRKSLRDLYGTVSLANGSRIYQSAYISVAKKNGKSFLVGGLPIYHLLMETERNPEAYGAAAAKDQAGIVFKVCAQLINANPNLLSRLKVLPSTKKILRRDGGGSYAVLSADGDVQDGIEPSLLIRDEIHRWKTQRAETLYDVITKGQMSRSQPLDIAVTTAGAEFESPLWWREYSFSKQVVAGAIQAPSHYVAIYEADPKRIEEDPAYWKSREARVAANPSHEDIAGGFLKDTAIVKELNKASADASERTKYLRYNLNVPIKSLEDPVIDMYQWQQQDHTGVDLRTWPTYDVDLLMSKWRLIDRPCFVGLDASWTTDLTAVVFVFPPFENIPELTVLPFFFMPEGRVDVLQRQCRVPYDSWIERGFIMATEGKAIDMRKVVDRIKWGREMFDLVELDYDPWNFRNEAIKLDDEGIKAIEVKQNFLGLSHATKFLLASYVQGLIRHGNNPVMNWMAGCLQLKYDQHDNVQPSKPERGKASKRIDGFAALASATARYLVAEDNMISATVRSVSGYVS